MQQGITKEEFLELAKAGKRVTVFRQFAADQITPVAAYQALTQVGDGSVLLESGDFDPLIGRYSYLGLRPFVQFRAEGRKCTLDVGGNITTRDDQPFELLKTLLREHSSVPHLLFPPLVGGAVGYVAYDAIRLFEKIPDRHPNRSGTPDLFFQFHEISIVFHHQKETMTICVSVVPGANPEKDYEVATDEISHIVSAITAPRISRPTPVNSDASVAVDIPDPHFCEMVKKAKEYIVAGDAFQIVLSRSFYRPYAGTPLDIYRALRFVNPSPYMFLINGHDVAFIGASPELLLSVQNGVMETMPIAGTRPRGKGAEDIALEKDLLADEKELAEHMMLVDLARNDLGAVAIPGSIALKDLKKVHRFSHVMHIVSRVHGTMRDDLNPLDALRSVFPAGTLSGAPKIRAMEIIDELEHSKRNLYGGAICAIDARGNLDSCIAIRMVTLQDGVATVRAGAGIVFDSDPQKEADETRRKAEGILAAIEMAEEGLV